MLPRREWKWKKIMKSFLNAFHLSIANVTKVFKNSERKFWNSYSFRFSEKNRDIFSKKTHLKHFRIKICRMPKVVLNKFRYSPMSITVFYWVYCTLFYIENDAEIFPAHSTWKVAEKGFKIAFMMNKLAMINSCEIILEK